MAVSYPEATVWADFVVLFHMQFYYMAGGRGVAIQSWGYILKYHFILSDTAHLSIHSKAPSPEVWMLRSMPKGLTRARPLARLPAHPSAHAIVTPYHYTETPQVYRHPATIQSSYDYTEIQPRHGIITVYRNPTTMQTSYHNEEILP